MLSRSIVLTGPPASGKSTLGRLLSSALGVRFEDSDREIEKEAGRSISEIFSSEGESGFRARERKWIERFLTDRERSVVATGGGMLLDATIRHRTLRTSWLIALTAPVETLIERVVRSEPNRPLLRSDPREQMRALLDARKAAYSEAHFAVSTEIGAAEALQSIQSKLEELERTPTLVMPLGNRSYRIYVDSVRNIPQRVARLAPSQTVWVTNPTVIKAIGGAKILGEGIRVSLSDRGERGKTLSSVKQIWDSALAANLDRDALIVGVGGGVITDLAGFAAATVLRGIRYASVPTTLLSMVDASVGGKTGFDHTHGKNLIGAFHQPSMVLCDPSVVGRQSKRQIRAGLAEIAKIALACDSALAVSLGRDATRISALDPEALSAQIYPAIQAKIDIVARDEQESDVRALLNFGHTIGHAIEQAAGYQLPHGECVALGMRSAIDLGMSVGVTPADVARDAHELLDALGLARTSAIALDARKVEKALKNDKKRRNGSLRFVLLTAIGSSAVKAVSDRDARRAIESLL